MCLSFCGLTIFNFANFVDHSSFDFISAVHILMIYFTYIIHIHLFYGNVWTHNWPAPNVSGFIAQLVRALHQYCKVTGSNPIKPEFFVQGFFTQLHKLHLQLQGSFFIMQSYQPLNARASLSQLLAPVGTLGSPKRFPWPIYRLMGTDGQPITQPPPNPDVC